MFLLVFVRHVGAHPGEHQHGVSIQISISLGKTFLRISCIRNTPLTWILARVFVYVPPFISHILDLIYWTVLILFWSSFEWRDTENQQYSNKWLAKTGEKIVIIFFQFSDFFPWPTLFSFVTCDVRKSCTTTIGLFHFLKMFFMDPSTLFRSIHTRIKNLANVQPSWPHAWLVIACEQALCLGEIGQQVPCLVLFFKRPRETLPRRKVAQSQCNVAWVWVRKVKQRITYQDDADTIACPLPQEIFYFFADFNAIHGWRAFIKGCKALNAAKHHG